MPVVVGSNDSRIPAGAELLKIDNQHILDIFDYQFFNDSSKPRKFVLSVRKKRKTIFLNAGDDIQLTLEEPEYKVCENNCDYCFIKGLPKGLRKELYFRDDDYRLSFMFGNFLSLTNITDRDIERIRKLRLSPLYVSVHTTDPELRVRLFKHQNARHIMDQLSNLVNNNIQIHCQVIIIPGLTDGDSFVKTIRDLSGLYPGISSIGVVPVGRTKYQSRIPAVNKKLTLEIVKQAMMMHRDFKKRTGKGFVYLADEFFIKSGLAIPERDYYDDFYQYENGIGMVRQLLDEIGSLKNNSRISGRILFVTGKIAFPYINYLREKLSGKRAKISVLSVTNKFLGSSITVSGLLTGRDISAAIRGLNKNYDRIILPPNCVNDNGRFLDDYRLETEKYMIAPYSVRELILWLQ